MKIAVAGMNDQVAEHFGHCECFHIYEAENGAVTAEKSIPNPGHKPGFLPNFLGDMGVGVILAGGMGGGAVDIFHERGIEVVTGVTGPARAAAEDYLHGTLKSTGSICHDHKYESECGSH